MYKRQLLTGGKEDPEWRAETKERIRDAADELLDARRRMEEDPDRSFEVRLVDNLFLFTKSGRPEHSISRLKEEDVYKRQTRDSVKHWRRNFPKPFRIRRAGFWCWEPRN